MSYIEKTDHYMDVITRQMENLGFLEDADRENLDLLRTQISLYYRALEELDKNGLTCYDKVGRLSVNPAFTIQRSAMTTDQRGGSYGPVPEGDAEWRLRV